MVAAGVAVVQAAPVALALQAAELAGRAGQRHPFRWLPQLTPEHRPHRRRLRLVHTVLLTVMAVRVRRLLVELADAA